MGLAGSIRPALKTYQHAHRTTLIRPRKREVLQEELIDIADAKVDEMRLLVKLQVWR
jgi:hypothetical protein